MSREKLIGTWAAAVWAIHFYEMHGFRLSNGQSLGERPAPQTVLDRSRMPG